MGMGDELMACGEARALHERTGRRVVILDRHGKPRWSPVWDGVPFLARERTAGTTTMVNAGGARPYIASKTDTAWRWKPYQPKPATFVLTPAERALGELVRGKVVVEPSVKKAGLDKVNKAWITDRWQAVVDRLPFGSVAQCHPPDDAHVLRDVVAIRTPTFRDAMGVLSGARLFVGTEGGMMHAAAALGVPAVILWTEFISPEITGYPQHRHIRHAGPPCGMRVLCRGCMDSSERITVDEVVDAIEKELAT